ncbi:unnamed protein product [Schistocephalus solidus]|uniref:Uncharacterized protein n=1 Tax=Schistocephalus solidus TaxID=70667 RepID=A0A3P7DI77_SCHSO|nr:unnamed protein product [Schistocephalus solidus]
MVCRRACSANERRRRRPLSLQLPRPWGPSTPYQAAWSVPTRALKSPRTINLSTFDTVTSRACRSS